MRLVVNEPAASILVVCRKAQGANVKALNMCVPQNYVQRFAMCRTVLLVSSHFEPEPLALARIIGPEVAKIWREGESKVSTIVLASNCRIAHSIQVPRRYHLVFKDWNRTQA